MDEKFVKNVKMDNLSIDLLANFPILNQAKELLEKENIKIDEKTIQKGYERIEKTQKKVFENKKEQEKIDDIISFVSAKMILSFFSNRFLIKKFSIAESKRMGTILKTLNDKEIDIFCKKYDIYYEKQNKNYLIDIFSYVNYSIKDKAYKITTKDINEGFIYTQKNTLIRLIESAIEKDISSIKLLKQEQAISEIKKYFPKLYGFLPNLTKNIKEDEIAPCMKKILEELEKHENLPHSARWILVTYLKEKNYSFEEIVEKFKNVPDFDEKKTTYHVDNVLKKNYTTPNCDKIQSYGLCVLNCKCNNPLRFDKYGKNK